MHPKWNPILWSKVVDFEGNRVPFGTHSNSMDYSVHVLNVNLPLWSSLYIYIPNVVLVIKRNRETENGRAPM
jgi:hypothetical protein